MSVQWGVSRRCPDAGGPSDLATATDSCRDNQGHRCSRRRPPTFCVGYNADNVDLLSASHACEGPNTPLWIGWQ